jgi:hypothetical protein
MCFGVLKNVVEILIMPVYRSVVFKYAKIFHTGFLLLKYS